MAPLSFKHEKSARSIDYKVTLYCVLVHCEKYQLPEKIFTYSHF